MSIPEVLPVTVNKHSSGEEDPLVARLSEHQIRGWNAVVPIVLYGQGSSKRSVFSQTPVCAGSELDESLINFAYKPCKLFDPQQAYHVTEIVVSY